MKVHIYYLVHAVFWNFNKRVHIYIYIYIYIQLWPERLTHYGFWKIIAFGSKNGFKMGEQCYHIVEYVVLII